MSDIVKRLRGRTIWQEGGTAALCHEAADEIETLRAKCEGIDKLWLVELDKKDAEIERLRGLAEKIAGLTLEGELVDEDSEREFEWENDDAWATVQQLISQARLLVGDTDE